MMLALDFSHVAFIVLRNVPYISILLIFFLSLKDIEFLSNPFYASIEMIVYFCFEFC